MHKKPGLAPAFFMRAICLRVRECTQILAHALTRGASETCSRHQFFIAWVRLIRDCCVTPAWPRCVRGAGSARFV